MNKPNSFFEVNRFPGLWLVVALAFFVAVETVTAATKVYYSFAHQNGGVACLNFTDGKVTSHEIVLEDLPFVEKIRVSTQGLIATSREVPEVKIVSSERPYTPIASHSLGGSTNDVQVSGDRAVIAADKGHFYLFDLESGKILREWNARDGLVPSGHKGEEAIVVPEKGLILVSFQKDSGRGKHQGSRLVGLGVADLSPRFDLQFPREMPEMHISESQKEQGPNPEKIFLARKSNTLAVTLDLYGAVAFASLDEALEGRWNNLIYVSSAKDGSFGTAFPDRGLLFELGNKEYLLVSNASEEGGMVIFDVASRTMIQAIETETGAEQPIYLPANNKIVTVLSGKTKSRTNSGLEKDNSPGSDLLVLDVEPLSRGEEAGLTRIPMGSPLTGIASLDPTQSLLLLATESKKLLVYDHSAQKVLSSIDAMGAVNRIEVLETK